MSLVQDIYLHFDRDEQKKKTEVMDYFTINLFPVKKNCCTVVSTNSQKVFFVGRR